MRSFCLLVFCASLAWTQERPIDPTFLHRFVPSLAQRVSDVTTAGCGYTPIFGAGDPDEKLLKGIARFGEMVVQPGGASAKVSRPDEEQVYVVLEGGGELLYGAERQAIHKNDYFYVSPATPHAFNNTTGSPCRILAMGFRVPRDGRASAPPRLLIANVGDVKKETVSGHPPSTLYQLLMGDTRSTRDRLAAAQILTSLFTMEFAAGGTNHPHHHETEEEIYLVLDGHGEMVAGSGADGIEGRYPAKVGDAYFFRLNCTVGFYAGNKEGEPRARILAARSLFPFRAR